MGKTKGPLKVEETIRKHIWKSRPKWKSPYIVCFLWFWITNTFQAPLELCNQIIGFFQVGVSPKPTNPKPILNTPRIQSWWTYHIGWSIQAPAWRNRQLLRWWRLLITMPRWERSISLERISTWTYLGSCVLKRGWLILASLWFPREKVHQWMIFLLGHSFALW